MLFAYIFLEMTGNNNVSLRKQIRAAKIEMSTGRYISIENLFSKNMTVVNLIWSALFKYEIYM